jgi:hypothetical protein
MKTLQGTDVGWVTFCSKHCNYLFMEVIYLGDFFTCNGSLGLKWLYERILKLCEYFTYESIADSICES